MEMAPECIPCLLGRVLFEAELCAPDKSAKVVRDSLKILSEGFEPGVNSAELATRVHRRVYSVLGCKDPYRELKIKSDEVALSLLPEAKEFIETSHDRLEAALLCSIAGNVLDFGIGTGFDEPDKLRGQFGSLVRQGLDLNDVPKVRGCLKSAKKIVYLLDNCGEVVFDKLLIEELKKFNLKIIGVVKGEPVLTDVSMEDARRVGIDEMFDELLSTGTFAVGIDMKRIGDRLRAEMNSADLIISKGMANFEALSNEITRPILYVMRAKCRPVAEAIGARKNDNVAKLFDQD